MKLTTGEAATRLGVSERRIRSMIKDGRIRARKAGRDWRIDEPELEKVQDRKPGRPKKPGKA